MGPRVVAVTGATGFVGRRLVPALAARGWRVRVLARNPTIGVWADAAPEVIVGDLASGAALTALTDGAEAVIHGAGLIKARDRTAFFAVNAAGARRVALASGARRMVLVSSLAAREPGLSDYAASKRAGEAAAQEVLGERLLVIRPPAIYGPGDRETLALFQAAGTSPIMPMPDDPGARLALAHIDEVVDVLVTAVEGSWPAGTFAVGGARPAGYGWREIFATAAAAMGRSPWLAPTPPWLIRGAAAMSESMGRVRGVPAIFNRGKARELLHPDWSVSPGELPPGGADPVELRRGFDDTVAWYRAQGWLA